MKRERILIIKLGSLGDVLIHSGMIRAIVERHPGAEITMMTGAPYVSLLKPSGWFADFFVDNRLPYCLSELKRVCRDFLAVRGFDRIYDMQSSHRTLGIYYRLVRLLTRQPLNWGRRVASNRFVFRRTGPKLPFAWGRAKTEELTFEPLPADISFCRGERKNFDLLPERYVLLIPGCSAGNVDKRWPADRYRALSEHFGARGLKSVVLGTSAEAAEIEAVVRGNPHAVDFMNKASLADIADLARGAVVVVGNDTGPTHMARLTGAKTVMLFCERTRRSAGRGANVINLFGQTTADIPVEQVVAAVERTQTE